MQNRRSALKDITPKVEDRGLFKKDLGQFRVALVPHIKRSSRGDLVIRGYLNGTAEVFVIFAGRRTKEALGIESRLKTMYARLNHAAAKSGTEPPQINSVRLGIRVEGSWRPRFQRDTSGWEHRSYQLLAARWAYADLDGMTNLGGRSPFT
ncbi:MULTISPECIES: hypothetical protein [Pseudophaeobacter]|jgi:hypothetical protein|uniref:hypothetical protein n=1 Tax=Pseudophaeobacter TaxID=1541822 RepID=UPI002430039F|nr:hypothetical protein [Pseudophaeobacter profundi]